MCSILRFPEAAGVAEGWRCECLEDLGSGKLNVSYSMVSGGSWEVSVPAKVGSMGDAAWRKSTANFGVPAKVGPSSAHRRLTWNAEAAVAAGRPPGSGRGSVAYPEKARCGSRCPRFLTAKRRCGWRRPALLPPSDSTPCGGAKSFRNLWYFSQPLGG